MRNPILLTILLSFFLQGCYQTSLAPIIGPAAGASQGRLAYSAASTSISYGVKHKTGKFPIGSKIIINLMAKETISSIGKLIRILFLFFYFLFF